MVFFSPFLLIGPLLHNQRTLEENRLFLKQYDVPYILTYPALSLLFRRQTKIRLKLWQFQFFRRRSDPKTKRSLKVCFLRKYLLLLFLWLLISQKLLPLGRLLFYLEWSPSLLIKRVIGQEE